MNLNEEQITGLHDYFFQTAKENVLRDGHLQPVVMLAFEAKNPLRRIRQIGLQAAPLGAEWEKEVAPIALIPVSHDATSLLSMLGRCMPELAVTFAQMRSSAPKQMTPAQVDGVIVRTFCKTRGCVEPDILANFLRWAADQLDAYALWKLDEAYVATASAEEQKRRDVEGGPAVKDIPGRRECVIATLETRTRSGILCATLEREDPKDETSKPVRFEDTMKDYSSVGGRFFGLVRKEAAP